MELIPSNSSTAAAGAGCSKKVPFTSSERELIVALVRERPIIEEKHTNAKNIYLKKNAWEELTVAFNTQPYVTKRNSQQLKRCWENIKTQRKKELAQDSYNLTRTGGGPPQGGSTGLDNVVDAICPFINLTVPGVIDSNSIEISDDLKKFGPEKISIIRDVELDKPLLIGEPEDRKILKRKLADVFQATNSEVITVNDNEDGIRSSQSIKKLESGNTPSGKKKFLNEVDIRIKRCSINIDQDKELHELRLKREKILIERENNLVEFEEEMHKLQLEKIKLEIKMLAKNTEN